MSAKREAFDMVEQTCPAVDRALEDAANAIKKQTGALREALIEAIQRAIDAEDKVKELEAEVQELKDKVEELEAERSEVAQP